MKGETLLALRERVRTAFQSEYIEGDLPYLASMMAAMSRAGMDLTDILQSLQGEETFSRSTRDLLSSMIWESQNESLSVVLNKKSNFYGGKIQSFLSGLAVETVKGNATPFLETFTSKLMAEKLREEREATTIEEILSISYAILFLLGPMVLITLLSALSNLSTAIIPLAGWFRLLFLLYVPMGTLFFTAPGWKKEPLKHMAPFLLACVVFFYAGLAVEHGSLSDTFISFAGLIFLPLGLYELTIWLMEQSIDRHLFTFLRDFAFQLLSGKDFLQTFKSLAEKQYGKLSQVLQKTVNAVELGETFTDSIRLLLHKTTQSKRITTLLTSLMRKGGDVSGIVESVSDFSWSVYQIEAEKRKKQYLTVVFFYIFFTVFLFLATTILQIFSVLAPIAGGGGGMLRMAKTLFDASVISAVCTGLVAGVLSTKRIGLGGIHVFMFTLMSMAFYHFIW